LTGLSSEASEETREAHERRSRIEEADVEQKPLTKSA
jgi:hypothetical protein